MPRQGDLPEPLVPLAHLNAVEILDPMFPDSVRHLINELQPFVPAKSIFRGWTRPGLGGLALFVTILLATLSFTVLMVRWRLSVVSNFKPTVETREGVPDPSKTLDGVAASSTPRIKVTTPADISQLPPVVVASKSVMRAGSSLQVTAPSKPRILWRASVTVGE